MINNKQCEIIIPTFYPGKVILELFRSIPSEYAIKIIDNGNDIELKKIISKSSLKIEHYEVGDIGLGKSFNYALSIIKTKFALITQPDVVLSENCIKLLIQTASKYPNAAIITPLYYDNEIYSRYDFYNLKLSKSKKLLSSKTNKKTYNYIPEGDFSVEAVNATAFLIDVEKIKSIGGWDEKFYTYLEDIDLCLRLRQSDFEIIKTPLAKVWHKGFSSHSYKNKEEMNNSRIWNFTWSSIYFTKKHRNNLFFRLYFLKLFTKALIKFFIYFLFNKKTKIKKNQIKLHACLSFILKKNFLDIKKKL